MTQDEIISKIKSDPDYVFSLIAENNPERIAANLRNMGISCNNDKEAVYANLKNLYKSGRRDMLIKAVNAPYLESRTPGYLAVMKTAQIVPAYKTAAGEEAAGQTKESESTWNWSDLFTSLPGILGGVADLTGGGSGANAPIPPTGEKKSNLIWWLLGLVLLVIIIIILVYAFKPKKKQE